MPVFGFVTYPEFTHLRRFTMAAIDDLKTAVDTLTANDSALKGSVDTAVAKINALAAEIAAAAANSNDAVIADLAAKVTSAASDLAADKAVIDAVAPPAA